jgi:hypothetical protein
MSVGGYNTDLHIKGEKTYIVDYKDNDGFYNINMYNIKVNGLDIGLN